MTELPASPLQLTKRSALLVAEAASSTGVIGSGGSHPTVTPFITRYFFLYTFGYLLLEY